MRAVWVVPLASVVFPPHRTIRAQLEITDDESVRDTNERLSVRCELAANNDHCDRALVQQRTR